MEKIKEVKKILDEALQRCQDSFCGDWSPYDVQELIIKVKATLNQLFEPKPVVPPEVLEATIQLRIDDAVKQRDLTASTKDAECQERVEGILDSMHKDFLPSPSSAFCGSEIRMFSESEWQALKKQEGVNA